MSHDKSRRKAPTIHESHQARRNTHAAHKVLGLRSLVFASSKYCPIRAKEAHNFSHISANARKYD